MSNELLYLALLSCHSYFEGILINVKYAFLIGASNQHKQLNNKQIFNNISILFPVFIDFIYALQYLLQICFFWLFLKNKHSNGLKTVIIKIRSSLHYW